jgi:hypothetical protein
LTRAKANHKPTWIIWKVGRLVEESLHVEIRQVDFDVAQIDKNTVLTGERRAHCCVHVVLIVDFRMGPLVYGILKQGAGKYIIQNHMVQRVCLVVGILKVKFQAPAIEKFEFNNILIEEAGPSPREVNVFKRKVNSTVHYLILVEKNQ